MKEGILIIVGNKACGYELKLFLPLDFVVKFSEITKIEIMGAYMGNNWGWTSTRKDYCYRTKNFSTKEEMVIGRERVIQEVKEAVAALKTDAINLEIHLHLGE